MRWQLSSVAVLAGLVAACSGDDAPADGGSRYVPTPLPALASVTLTDEATWAPAVEPLASPDARSPADPDEREAMLDDGFGELVADTGWAHVTHAPPDQTPPAPGAGARLLARFAHLPDFQLVDDESPARLAAFDSAGLTGGAFRPQEEHQCRFVNAMVRTLNAYHETTPLSFALLGGDNIDNAQHNELDWVLAILGGADSVECDSGADDDPFEGPDNDAKDPFVAEGLAFPWYWLTGNHDVLRQGNFVVGDADIEASMGSDTVGGTRDWSQAGGPVVKGEVVADASRRLLTPREVLELVAADGDGHGITSDIAGTGKAFYTFDVPDTRLRFLVLDTNGAATGSADGVLRRSDVDAYVVPALEQAEADGKWVVLASHHATGSLRDGGGPGGSAQADALLEADWLELIGDHPSVVFSLVGHSHQHQIRLLQPSGGSPWWEVMSAALADFPHQGRIVEIYDQDNGWLMLRATAVDMATDDDPVTQDGLTLGTLDTVSGWSPDGRGADDHRNVELWIEAPP